MSIETPKTPTNDTPPKHCYCGGVKPTFVLNLTPQEIKDRSYLDWDDATLGGFMKRMMLAVDEPLDPDGDTPLTVPNSERSLIAAKSAALVLCNLAHRANAEEMDVGIDNMTIAEDLPIGDWLVSCKKVDSPLPNTESNS